MQSVDEHPETREIKQIIFTEMSLLNPVNGITKEKLLETILNNNPNLDKQKVEAGVESLINQNFFSLIKIQNEIPSIEKTEKQDDLDKTKNQITQATNFMNISDELIDKIGNIVSEYKSNKLKLEEQAKSLDSKQMMKNNTKDIRAVNGVLDIEEVHDILGQKSLKKYRKSSRDSLQDTRYKTKKFKKNKKFKSPKKINKYEKINKSNKKKYKKYQKVKKDKKRNKDWGSKSDAKRIIKDISISEIDYEEESSLSKKLNPLNKYKNDALTHPPKKSKESKDLKTKLKEVTNKMRSQKNLASSTIKKRLDRNDATNSQFITSNIRTRHMYYEEKRANKALELKKQIQKRKK